MLTTLACAAGMEDPGRMADDATRRPDPEVPGTRPATDVHREVQVEGLTDYDAAPDGERRSAAS